MDKIEHKNIPTPFNSHTNIVGIAEQNVWSLQRCDPIQANRASSQSLCINKRQQNGIRKVKHDENNGIRAPKHVNKQNRNLTTDQLQAPKSASKTT